MRFGSQLISALLMMSFSSSVLADQQERAAAALDYASRITVAYRNSNDNKVLFNADRAIERAFTDLVYYHGSNTDLARDLALIRAKSATSRNDKSRVTQAWQLALELQPTNLPAARRLSLNVQAANATAKIGNIRASTQYFAAARTYAFSKDRDTKSLQLQLRLQELRALGQQMGWRRLRDNLLDMRRFSEGFSMWTLPRLEALISETEIRVLYEPENAEKRTNLADLRSKIELMIKGMGNTLQPTQINRVRNLYYTLEDNYAL